MTKRYNSGAPKGMAGVIDLAGLDTRNVLCTLHCSHHIDVNVSTRCCNPASYFYVSDLGGPSASVIPRCEKHKGNNSLVSDEPEWINWVEVTREDLLNLQLVEETMKE